MDEYNKASFLDEISGASPPYKFTVFRPHWVWDDTKKWQLNSLCSHWTIEQTSSDHPLKLGQKIQSMNGKFICVIVALELL